MVCYGSTCEVHYDMMCLGKEECEHDCDCKWNDPEFLREVHLLKLRERF